MFSCVAFVTDLCVLACNAVRVIVTQMALIFLFVFVFRADAVSSIVDDAVWVEAGLAIDSEVISIRA